MSETHQAKAVRVALSLPFLEELLGIDFTGIQIYAAQMNTVFFKGERLELLLIGDGLSDAFIVHEGEMIKEGNIIIRHKVTETSIVPVT